MKKQLLLYLLTFLLSPFVFGQYLSEGFESTNSLPSDWVLTQTNTSETWEIGTTSNSGSQGATVAYDFNQNETLTSPSIDLSSATNPRLIFYWNMSYYWSVAPYDNYDLIVSIDDGTNVTQLFTEADAGTFTNYTWYEQTIDLSAYVGLSDVKILFNYTGNDGAALYIDDILVEETPSCNPVTDLAVTFPSSTEAQISWTAGGSETEWTYEYGPSGFTQGDGIITITGPNNPITLGGLSGSYDIYVQANCGAGDDSTWSTISWTMPPANDTMAGAIPITPSPEGTGCNAAGFTLNFSTDGTTDSGMDGTCNTTNTGLDQFFTWTATTVGLLWNDAAPGNPGIVIRDMSGNEIACAGTFADDDTTLTGWEIGDDLIIQIYDYGTSVSDVAFCLEEYTPPAPIVPNYTETFDTYLPDRWSEASGAYGSPSGTTGSFTADDFVNDTSHPNGKSARINIYGTSVDEYLISPEFNLTGSDYFLNFDVGLTEYANTNAATLGDDDYVALLVTQDGGSTWTELDRWDSTTPISETGVSALEKVLSGYGDTVQFAFYAFSDTSNEDNDFFIDNFQITSATLGTENNTLEGFTLYPTIVKEALNFNSQKNVEAIAVYNLLGQEVYKGMPNANSSSINLSSLRPGVYLVKVTAEGLIGSYKIIKE